MKLILIYGPPAAGKLTVAKEVSKLTGFKVFHNHLSYDLSLSILPERTDEFWEFCNRLRFDSIEVAAKAGVDGLIFTFCYVSPSDDEFIRDIIAILERNDSQLLPVRLQCEIDVLKSRATNEDRREFKKISSAESIEETMSEHDFLQRIPGVESLDIANTEGTAGEAASRIKEFYGIWL